MPLASEHFTCQDSILKSKIKLIWLCSCLYTASVTLRNLCQTDPNVSFPGCSEFEITRKKPNKLVTQWWLSFHQPSSWSYPTTSKYISCYFFTGICLTYANLCNTCFVLFCFKKKDNNENVIPTRNKTEFSLIVKEPIQNHGSLHH